MAGTPDTTPTPDDDGELLPDEQAAIEEREHLLDELDDDEMLTVDEVAEDLDIDLD